MLSASPIASVANISDADADLQASGADVQQISQTSLIFIDESVQDLELLIDANELDAENATIIVLSSDEDGIDQITRVLAGYKDVESIHVLSHGSGGELRLGNATVDYDSLNHYSQSMIGWRDSLTSDSDILIYGCDLASTEDGRELIESLSLLTSADVAASDDLTGHSDLGGDWDLEFTVGAIDSDLFFVEQLQSTWYGLLGPPIVVTTTLDVIDGGDGLMSLREAILQANAGSGGDTITLAAGTYSLGLGSSGDSNGNEGDLDIQKSVTIVGAGAGSTIIDGDGFDRVFHIQNNSTIVNMSGVTVRGGSASDNGAGFYVDDESTLNLSYSAVQDNDGGSGKGGGFHVHGTLNLDSVLVSGNTADKGAGIHFHNAVGGTLTNVTISGNTAGSLGGGIWTEDTISIVNSTIAFNVAPNGGAIFDDGSGNVTVTNTILHSPISQNSNTTLVSGGYNIDSDGSAGLVSTGDQAGSAPLLDALAFNGGPTQTHALLAGSSAINAGTNTGAPTVDQRGLARDSIADIGAYESLNFSIANTGEFLVNETTAGTQQTHRPDSVTIAPDGSYVVVWTSNQVSGDDGDGNGVLMRRFNRDGTPATGETQVNQTTTGNQQYASIAMDATGQYVIVWEDVQAAGDGGTIYMRRFNADGTAIDANDVRVNTTTTGEQLQPAVAVNDSGTIVVTWQDDNGDEGIRAKLFDMTTTAVAGSVGGAEIAVTSTANADDPSVDLNSNGEFIVVWTQSDGVYWRPFDSTGAATRSAAAFESNGSDTNHFADVVLFDDGTFVTASTSTVSIGVNINTAQYALRDSTGTELGSDVSFITFQKSRITQTGVDSLVISHLEGVTGDVRVRHVSAAGGTLTSPGAFTAAQTSSGTQQNASLAAIDADNYVVVWSGNGDQPGEVDDSGVFARQFGTAPQFTANDDSFQTDQNTTLIAGDSGVLSNDQQGPTATVGNTLGHSAGNDTNGDLIWDNGTATSGFNWDFSGGGATYTDSPNSTLSNIAAAWSFDGTGGGTAASYQTIAGDPTNDPASFELWFNPTDATGQEIIFETGGNGQGTSLSLNGSTLELLVTKGSGVALATYDLSAEISGDEFIHVVGVIDNASVDPDVYLYVNGVLVDSVMDVTGLTFWGNGNGSGLGMVNGDTNTTNTSNFEGEIAEFRLYESAMSSVEIQTNFDAKNAAGSNAVSISNVDTSGTTGSVVLNGDGSFTFTPQAGFVGSDSFSYTATNGAYSDTATVTIAVNGTGNTVPIANTGGPYSIDEGNALNLDGSSSSDGDGDTLSYAWDLDNDGVFEEAGEPTSATATVTWATLQSFGLNSVGVHTIGLQVNDGNGGISTTTTTLTVNDAVDINSNLVLHLEFEEGSGTTAADTSTNSNDATLDASAEQDWETGAIGGGFHFDASSGNNDFFVVPNSASLENVQEGNAFTLAAWFNPDDVPSGVLRENNDHAYGILVKEGDHTGIWYNNNQKFKFEQTLHNGFSNVYVELESINTYSPGIFHHVAATVDRVAGTASLYVDGVLDNTVSFTAGMSALEYNQETWKVGTAQGTFANNDYAYPAKGTVDDVRIYERELDAAEVAALFALSTASNTPVVTTGQSFSVSESASNGTSIGTAAATDADTGTTFSNWTITGGNSDGIFAIDATTGAISVSDNSNLDFETTAAYTLTITVSDGTNTSVAESVSITIADANDNAPVIATGQIFSVSETSANGTTVGTVVANDGDAGTTLSGWAILAGNSDGIFAINPSTGVISVVNNSNLDFSTTASYTLTATVSDGTNTSTQETIAVNVSQSVAPVVVDDAYSLDEGGTLTESAVTGWDNPSWKTRQQITFDNSGQATNLLNHVVLVRLHDSAADAVNVDYSKIQDAGQDLRFYDGDGTLLDHQIETWDESGYSYVWVEVPQIDAGSTTDFIWMYYDHSTAPDGQNATATWESDDVVVLHLTDHTGDSTSYGNFANVTSIGGASGIVSGAASFNGSNSSGEFFANSSIDNIFDGGGTVSAWINLNGWGENGYGRIADKAETTFGGAGNGDGWVFQVGGSGSSGRLIFEHGFSGDWGEWRTSLGTLSLNSWHHVAIVYDSTTPGNDPIFYIDGVAQAVSENRTPTGVARSDTSESMFLGNNSAGTRTFNGAIDEFRVSNASTTADEIAARFQAIDSSLVTGSVTESGPGGLLSNDLDADGDVLTVSLVSGPANASSFTLNPDGSFTYVHDGSETTSDSFEYQVSDGGLTQTGTVNLTVGLVNDNSPEITTGQTFNVSELAANGTTVGTVAATDADTDGTLGSWTIIAGNSDSIFAINSATGQITVADNANLDFETTNSYSLSLQVSDGLFSSVVRSVVINVDNQPEAPTVEPGGPYTMFAGDSLSVDGSLSTDEGSIVGYAWDLDNDGLFGEPGEPTAGTTTISWSTLNTFGITTSGVHTIGLQVTDNEGVTSTATTSLTVNNSDPTFTSTSTFSVNENTTNAGTATVSDPIGTSTFSISGGNDAARFSIDSVSGQLAFNLAPDFESPVDSNSDNVYEVQVTANNGFGSNSQSISVTVNAVNEAPSLSLLNTINNVAENSSTTTAIRVADIQISDDGQGTNNIILSGANAGLFEVVSGELRLKAGTVLDHETDAFYSVTVTVDDGAIGSGVEDTEAFMLTVGDVNEAPVYSGPVQIDLNEDQGTTAYNWATWFSDADANDWALDLSVVNVADGWVDATINPHTGRLTVTTSSNQSGTSSIIVRATDSNGATADATVTVEVVPTNDTVTPADQSVLVQQSGSASGSLIDAAIDPDGETLTIVVTQAPTNGILTVAANGDFVFVPDNDFVSTEFKFVVNDGVAVSSVATVEIQSTLAPQDPVPESRGTKESEQTAEESENELENQDDAEGELDGNSIATDYLPLGNLGHIESSIESVETGQAETSEQLLAAQLVASSQDQQQLNGRRGTGNPLQLASRSLIVQQGSTSDPRLATAFSIVAQPGMLWQELDSIRKESGMETAIEAMAIGSVGTVTSSLIVGYVVWAIRSGLLLSSLVASMPAWNMLDPLAVIPIAGSGGTDDGESLEDIVENQKKQIESHEIDARPFETRSVTVE